MVAEMPLIERMDPRGNCQEHWDSVAHQWKHWKPPLRPCAADIEMLRQSVWNGFSAERRNKLNVLLLGVTPEIAEMAWPEGTRLQAVDRSAEMIEVVWPGNVPGRREARQGQWLSLPFADRQFDVVVGDGCFIHMDYPHGWTALSRSLRRVIRDDGLMLMRFFVQGPDRETPEEVYLDLKRGDVESFHVFKWRLAMALQQSSAEGVRVHDVWQHWDRAAISMPELARQTGWPPESIRTITLYRDKQVTHTFPTLAEALDAVKPFFAVQLVQQPAYELGERCPIVTFRPA